MSLTSGSANPGGPVTLPLVLNTAGSRPTGLQWSLGYNAGDVASVDVIAGAAGTAAGKSVQCKAGSGSTVCVLTGFNQTAMADGAVATVVVQLAAAPSSPTIPVSLTGVFGTTDLGDSVPMVSTGATISVLQPSAGTVTLSSLACNPAAAGVYGCTVTLSSAAPAGGALVSLSSSAPEQLTVPATILIPAGTTSATFNATAGAVSSTVTASVKASYNGSSGTTSVTIAPGTSVASLSAVTCTPSALTTPGNTTCTVTLSGAAPAGGAVVSLSPSVAVLAMPGSVVVPAGAASATFTVTASALQSELRASIQASYKGGVAISVITLLPMSTTSVATVTCSPSTVVTPGTAACTVTLSGAAPSSGAVVSLSSSLAQLAVAPSVVVPAGASSASFTATASEVSVSSNASVTASYNGTSGIASLTLAPAPAVSLASLSCSPASIAAPANTTCTVSLSGPAPAGGAVVSLSPSVALLTMPGSVAVSAGASSATFTATALAVQSDTRVSLQASYKGSAVTSSVTLTTAAKASIASLSCSPSPVTTPGTAACTVSLSAPAPAGGAAISLTSSAAQFAVPASVSVPAGASSASFTGTASAVSANTNASVTASYNGTQANASVTLAAATVAALGSVTCTPSSITTPGTATCTITLSGPAPAGGAAVSVSPSIAQLSVPGSVLIAAGATSANFTATASALTSEVRASLQASYNGAAVASSLTLLPASTTSVASVTCSPSTVTTPGTAACTVTLSGAAPQSGAAVSLSSAATQLAVPASVVVPAGAVSAGFTATASAVSANTNALVTATYNGTSGNSPLTLAPASNASLSSVACTPSSITTPGTTTCAVTLSGPAPAGGAAVSVSPSIAQLTMPSIVSVPAGATSASFTVSASALPSEVRASLQASYKGNVTAGYLTLLPASTQVLSSIGCTTATPVAGSTVSCSVALSSPAPAGGTAVTLTSSSPVATVPGTLTVPAGASTASFSMALAPSPLAADVTLTAAASGSKSVTLNVQPLKVSSLVCSPSSVTAGGVLACQATLNTTVTTALVLNNVASTNLVSVPATASVPAGSNYATYAAYSKAGTSGSVTISSMWGGSTAPSTVSIVSGAKAAAPAAAMAETAPHLDSVLNAADPNASAACSPGAAAALNGSHLSQDDTADLDINGQPALVLSASPARIIFRCPEDAAPETELRIRVRNAAGDSNVLRTTMREVAPAIFTVSGAQGPFGLILASETAELVIETPEVKGTPAHPGEVISIFSTGLGRSSGTGEKTAIVKPVVWIDGMSAEVVSATLSGNGVYRVDVRLPDSVRSGTRIPLTLEASTLDGKVSRSGSVVFSIAPAVTVQ